MNGESSSSPEALRDPRWQAAILAGITVAVFSPTLAAGFVYDARLQILTDPFLHDPGNWLNVLTFRTLSMDVLDFNRPVNLASLMLDAMVWGKEPFGYHLTSIMLHVANVLLVWEVIRRLAARPADAGGWRGLCTAVLPPLFFAVHPVVTEAVCEPTFREDLLVASFTLGALVLAMGHATGAAGGDWWRALGCIACCLYASGSKESGVTAPLVLAVYWWLFRRGEPRSFWIAAVGGAVVAVLCFLAARFLLETVPSRIFENRPQYPGGSLAAALAIEPRILALYAQLILVPVNLSADYGLYSVRHLPLSVSIVVLAVVAALAVMAMRADRRMVLALAIVVLPLIPVANLVPIYRAAADRYLYLPMAGVALAGAFLLDAPKLVGREKLRDGILLTALTAAVVLGVACMERQQVWADAVALWEDTYRKNPVAYTAASGLGDALREIGRLPEAEKFTREAIRLSDGNRGDVWATLALILDAQGRFEEAREAVGRALEVDPRLARPEERVAVMAMERAHGEAFKDLLSRLDRRP